MKHVFLFVSVLMIGIIFTPAAFAEIPKETTPIILSPNVLQYNEKTSTIIEDHNKGIGSAEFLPYERIQDSTDQFGKPVYKNYRLEVTNSTVKIETGDAGSISWDKATCSYNYYNAGIIGQNGNATLKGISWTVKGKQINATSWASLNSLNNAACNTSLEYNDDHITITGTKTVTNVGTFQIVLNHEFGKGLKETMRGFNANPAWNNHVVGFTETIQVPKLIKFGNTTYDISQHNNLRLDRNWIQNNKAKMIDLSSKLRYDLGLGYNNLDSILLIWDGTKAKLAFDYLYVNSIVPYNTWIEVDPTFSQITSNSGRITSTGAGASCPALIANIYTDVFTLKGASGSGAADLGCQVAYFKYNLSTISAQATLTQAAWKYDITSLLGTPVNCDLRISSTNTVGQQMYTDGIFGTGHAGTNATVNFAGCKTTGNNKSVSIDSSAFSTLQSKFGSNVTLVVGYNVFPNGRGASTDASQFRDDNARLNMTFTIPAPSSLSCSGFRTGAACSWTANAPSATTGYIIQKSSNNSTWVAANQTLIGNVTSYTLTSGLTAGQQIYLRVNATYSGYNSTESNHQFVTTDITPYAPQTSNTEGTSASSIRVRWNTPTSDGGDTITSYRIRYYNITGGTGPTILSSNTTNTILNYNFTGLHFGHTYKFQVAAGNGVGFGAYSSNMTATTFETTAGSISLSTGVVGDVIQANSTITITDGSPSPINISQSRLYVDGVLAQTRAENTNIETGSSGTIEPIWYQFLDASSHNFSIKVTASNTTGTVTLSSANTTASREYPPSYFAATDTVEGLVNYTATRTDNQDTLNLKVNRDKNGNTFQIECLYQTNSQAQFGPTSGTWHNFTGVGYMNDTITDVSNTHLYISCYNSGLLFTTTSYTNSSLALFGIQVFDESYGSMLGVPVGIFFLAMAGAMANKRTAPTWIIVVLGMAGTMAAIGFFTFNPLVWGLALVTGLLGVFVNQKVF